MGCRLSYSVDALLSGEKLGRDVLEAFGMRCCLAVAHHGLWGLMFLEVVSSFGLCMLPRRITCINLIPWHFEGFENGQIELLYKQDVSLCASPHSREKVSCVGVSGTSRAGTR